MRKIWMQSWLWLLVNRVLRWTIPLHWWHFCSASAASDLRISECMHFYFIKLGNQGANKGIILHTKKYLHFFPKSLFRLYRTGFATVSIVCMEVAHLSANTCQSEKCNTNWKQFICLQSKGCSNFYFEDHLSFWFPSDFSLGITRQVVSKCLQTSRQLQCKLPSSAFKAPSLWQISPTASKQSLTCSLATGGCLRVATWALRLTTFASVSYSGIFRPYPGLHCF